MRRALLLSIVLCVVSAVFVLAQNPMRPGSWEVTNQMQMAGSPIQMPAMKMTQCITPEQMKDPANALPNASPNPNAKSSCKVSDYAASDNKVTWKLSCPTESMSGSGELTFEGDSYAGALKMMSPQGEITMKLTGKRIGDCDK